MLAADVSRPPAAQLTTRAALGGIHLYQATLSPLYAKTGVICRFKPTCSHYGEAVIREFGALKGGWLAAKRVVRCGPWTPLGTDDPPPTRASLNPQSSIRQSNSPISNPSIAKQSPNRSIGNLQFPLL